VPQSSNRLASSYAFTIKAEGNYLAFGGFAISLDLNFLRALPACPSTCAALRKQS
jgi:hypothetical protein